MLILKVGLVSIAGPVAPSKTINKMCLHEVTPASTTGRRHRNAPMPVVVIPTISNMLVRANFKSNGWRENRIKKSVISTTDGTQP